MPMKARIEIFVPEGLLAAIDAREIARLTPEWATFHAFRRGVVTSGRAAELLGISRAEFLDRLSAAGIIYFDPGEEEIRSEREAAEGAVAPPPRPRRPRSSGEGRNASRGG